MNKFLVFLMIWSFNMNAAPQLSPEQKRAVKIFEQMLKDEDSIPPFKIEEAKKFLKGARFKARKIRLKAFNSDKRWSLNQSNRKETVTLEDQTSITFAKFHFRSKNNQRPPFRKLWVASVKRLDGEIQFAWVEEGAAAPETIPHDENAMSSLPEEIVFSDTEWVQNGMPGSLPQQPSVPNEKAMNDLIDELVYTEFGRINGATGAVPQQNILQGNEHVNDLPAEVIRRLREDPEFAWEYKPIKAAE